MHRVTYACVKDREVSRTGHCPVCHEPMKYMGAKWRAPRKRNKRAWQRIEAGEVLWDRKATALTVAQRERWQEMMQKHPTKK